MSDALNFNVDGEFITQLARRWYYVEHKPYEKSEELLLCCMEGTNETKEELQNKIRNIMLGTLKLKGFSDDEGLYIEADNFDTLYYIEGLQKELKKEQEKCSRYRDTLNEMYDKLDDGSLKYEEKKNPLIESMVKAFKTEDNYGWLTPDGIYTPIDWGGHQEWATLYIKNNNELYAEFLNSKYKTCAGDFLVYQKGWLLLNNPAHGVAVPLYDESLITKEQKQFLYQYYSSRDETDMAMRYRY